MGLSLLDMRSWPYPSWPGGPGLEASALRPWPGGWAWKLWHGICGMEALSLLTESDSMALGGYRYLD